jgi:hypothetical protein
MPLIPTQHSTNPSLSIAANRYHRGLHDARSWAESVGFTRNGQRAWPTAQELGRDALPIWPVSADEGAPALPVPAAPAPAWEPALAAGGGAAAPARVSGEVGGEAAMAMAALAAGGRLELRESARRPGHFVLRAGGSGALAPSGAGASPPGGGSPGSATVSDLQLLVAELGVPRPDCLRPAAASYAAGSV